MPRVVPAVGPGPYLQANRSVAAGGPQQQAEPQAAPQSPAGMPAGGLQVAGMQLSPELLAGLSFENGAIKIPAAKVQELIAKFAGRDWSVAIRDGSFRLEKHGGAKVWTTLTPAITEQGSVRIALSDTKWNFFIFGGRVSNSDARDRVLKEVGKHLRPKEVDDDDIREYREKKAELAKMRDRVVRLEALPSAGDEKNARKLREYREKIGKLERKLASKHFAGVRAALEPSEPGLAEKIGRTLRPDGSDAVAFDLPLPAGIRVESVKVSPEGLLVKVAGSLGGFAPGGATPGAAPASAAPGNVAPPHPAYPAPAGPAPTPVPAPMSVASMQAQAPVPDWQFAPPPFPNAAPGPESPVAPGTPGAPAAPVAPLVPAPVPTGGSRGTVFLPIGNLGQAIAAIDRMNRPAQPAPGYAAPPPYAPAPAAPGYPVPAVPAPAYPAPQGPVAVPGTAQASAANDGIAAMLAKLPTGTGTAMGFVPVTIARDGAGLRFEAPVIGQVQITQAGGQWQVIKGGEVAAFVKRAVEGRDAQGNAVYTLELASGTKKMPPDPITFTVADGGRTLRYGSYTVTMNHAAAA